MPKFEIRCDAEMATTRVLMDGHPVEELVDVSLTCPIDDIVRVHMTVNAAPATSFDGDAAAHITIKAFPGYEIVERFNKDGTKSYRVVEERPLVGICAACGWAVGHAAACNGNYPRVEGKSQGPEAPAPTSLRLMTDLEAEQLRQLHEAYGYLSRLFVAFAPQCTPFPDLPGLCMQIDNLLTGPRADALRVKNPFERLADAYERRHMRLRAGMPLSEVDKRWRDELGPELSVLWKGALDAD